MSIDLSIVQPTYTMLGLASAALALAVTIRARAWAADVAAVVVSIGLVSADQLPTASGVAIIVVVGATVLAIGGSHRDRVLVAGYALALALLIGGRDLITGAAAVMLVAAVAGAAFFMSRPGPRWYPLPLAICVGGALTATAGGAPDTETAIATAVAVVPTLALSPRVRAHPGMGGAAITLAAWVAVDSYRGRPGGLPAAAVALAVVVAGAILSRGEPNRAALGVSAFVALLAAVSARAIGLDAHATATDIALASAASVGVIALGVFSARWSARGPGDTHPGSAR